VALVQTLAQRLRTLGAATRHYQRWAATCHNAPDRARDAESIHIKKLSGKPAWPVAFMQQPGKYPCLNPTLKAALGAWMPPRRGL
jgi:hypothetical protein